MQTTEHHVLLIDGPSALLSACLWQLAGQLQHKTVTLLLVGPSRNDFQDALVRTLGWYAYQQGFFQAPEAQALPVQLRCCSEADLHSLALDQAVDSFWACPAQYQATEHADEDTEITLVFSDRVLAFFEHHPAFPLDEAPLERALEQVLAGTQPQLWLDEPELTLRVKAFLKQAEAQTALWEDADLGPLYRCLWALAPWQTVHLPQLLAKEITALIEASIATEALHWQLLIALFRRRLSADFGSHPLLDTLLPREKAIQLLKPIQNWKVTVVAPTYNRLAGFKRTIEAILNQTYTNWELILLDHASTDGTAQYCDELVAQDSRIRLIRKQENRGPQALAVYYNDILATLDTELLVSCPDDDWLLPTYLEKQIALFQARPWMSMVFGAYYLVDRNGVPNHQHGPLYQQAGATNPLIELERTLLAGLVPQCALFRFDAMRVFAQWDITIPPDSPYGMHDFLVGIYLQSLYEAGHVPEVLFNLTADTTTANQQFDISDRWLCVLQSILRCYEGLFGPGLFPREAMTPYYRMMVGNTLKLAQEHLLNAPSPELDPVIFDKLELLKQMAEFSREQMVQTSASRQHLFHGQNAFRALPEPQVPTG